jgi:hypothetical protein
MARMWHASVGQLRHHMRCGLRSVSSMKTDETARRVVGLLTAAYTIDHEGGTAEDFAAMVNPLLSDLFSNLQIIDTGNSRATAQLAADQVNQDLKPVVTEVISTFLSAFTILYREYEAVCPDADIPRILQNLGLSIDADD